MTILKEDFDKEYEKSKTKVTVEEYEKLSSKLLFGDHPPRWGEGTRAPFRAALLLCAGSRHHGLLLLLLPRRPCHVRGTAPYADATSGIGYTTGFLIVILGRLQLFTEHTITAVIPLWEHPSWYRLMRILRLWAIVLGSNMVGTFIAALFMTSPYFAGNEISTSLGIVAGHVMHFSAGENIFRGIPAGMLIAAIVWMLPMSRGFSFFTILTFTYFIAIGGFAHVVVGSGEAAYAVLTGASTVSDYFFRFLIPTGLGNIIGGTGIFTLLVSAQVKFGHE